MTASRTIRTMILASVGSLAMLTGQTAFAQLADQARPISLVQQPLASAIADIERQTGVAISIQATGTDAVTIRSVEGRLTTAETLDRALAGSGLIWHVSGPNSVVIEGVAGGGAESGERMLGVVRIEGAQGGAPLVGLDGFGPGAGANGSSDVTATEGTGSLTTNGTSIATKTPQSLKDIPQSVSVLTATQIRQQNITNVNDALQSVPGLTMVSGANGASTILSRGFTVGTFVVDGGAPLAFSQSTPELSATGTVTPDMSEYDHVEVLKGSAALFGGASDPGGVVSLQRKRPLDHGQVLANAQIGMWDFKRIELDGSSPLAFDGKLRGRMVGVYQDQDFSVDLAHRKMARLYGVLEGDVGHDTIVRLGGSYQDTKDRAMNNGLPRYNNGGDPKFPRSTNLQARWASQHNKQSEMFGDVEHEFSEGWSLKASATHLNQRTDILDSLMAAYGLNPDGSGFYYVGPVQTRLRHKQTAADLHLNGKFTLFGLEQSFVLGVDYQNSRIEQPFSADLDARLFLPINPFSFSPVQLGLRPSLNPDYFETAISRVEQYGAYLNTILQPVEHLRITGGLRWSNADRKYHTFNNQVVPTGPISIALRNIITPSVSISYDVLPAVAAYASYSDVYNPAGILVTDAGDVLPPLRGATYEAGLKFASVDKSLNASVAVFKVRQRNVAIQVSSSRLNNARCCFVGGGAIETTGAELSLSGAVTRDLQINAGYTYSKVRFNDAYSDALVGGTFPFQQTQQPRHQAKFWATYTPSSFDRLSISAGGRLESSRFTRGLACSLVSDPTEGFCEGGEYDYFEFKQRTYAVVDASVGFKATPKVEVALSLTNITDTRYFANAALPAGGSFYGEPRRLLLSIRAGL